MKKFISNICCLTALTLCSANLTHASEVLTEVVKPDLVRQEYFEIINEYRERINLKRLKELKVINGQAYGHSKAMATGERAFGHIGFSERCQNIKSSVKKSNLCGEIVAWGQKTPEDVFEAWMGSPGHRDKIEQGRFTHTGFGYYKNSKGRIYWTQIFLEIN